MRQEPSHPCGMPQAADRAMALLQVTSLLCGARFEAVCDVLRPFLITGTEYQRPTGPRFHGCVPRQGIPEMPGSDKVLLSEHKFIRPHVCAAQKLENFPGAFDAAKAAPDLIEAVKWTASFAERQHASFSYIEEQ